MLLRLNPYNVWTGADVSVKLQSQSSELLPKVLCTADRTTAENYNLCLAFVARTAAI